MLVEQTRHLVIMLMWADSVSDRPAGASSKLWAVQIIITPS